MEALQAVLEMRRTPLPEAEDDAAGAAVTPVDARSAPTAVLRRLVRAHLRRTIGVVRRMCGQLLAHAAGSEIDSTHKYRLTQLAREVAILGRLLEKLSTLSRAGAVTGDSENDDANDALALLNAWLTNAHLATKLVILLSYLAATLQLPLNLTGCDGVVLSQLQLPLEPASPSAAAAAQADAPPTPTLAAVATPMPLDVSLYITNGALRTFWASAVGVREPTCPLKAFMSALEGEWEVGAMLSEATLAGFAQAIVSVPGTVSIFCLDEYVRSVGLVTALAIKRGEFASAEAISTDIAALVSTATPDSVADRETLVRLQRRIDAYMTMQEEQLQQLDAKLDRLRVLLQTVEPPHVAAALLDIAQKDHQSRTVSERAARQQLQQLYQLTVTRITDLANEEQIMAEQAERRRQREGSATSTASGSSISNPPHDLIRRSRNFQEVMENMRRSAEGVDMQRLNELVNKLNEGNLEHVRRPDAEMRKLFQLAPNEQFIYGVSCSIRLPTDTLLTVGVLYIFAHTLCFQRTFWQERGPYLMPLHRVLRLLKVRDPIPPFFDASIQIELCDPAASYLLASLSRRDVLFELLQLLVRSHKHLTAAAAESQLDMGMIVTEEVYQNERYLPLAGFTQPLNYPAYSDQDGTAKFKEGMRAPSGSRWISRWQIDRSLPHLDAEGWEYATAFKTSWGPRTPAVFVRRRKWVRQRVNVPPDFDAPGRSPLLGREVELFADDGTLLNRAVL